MRIFGIPARSPTFDMAVNFSTIARTFPGLQYMMSRTRYMSRSEFLGTRSCLPRESHASIRSKRLRHRVAQDVYIRASGGSSRHRARFSREHFTRDRTRVANRFSRARALCAELH